MGCSRTSTDLVTITSLVLLILTTPLLAAERGSTGDLYVVDYWHDRVLQFDAATGERVGDFAEFPYLYPYRALLIDSVFGGDNNNLFLAPQNSKMIAELDGRTGALLRTLPLRPGSCNPTGVKIGPNGNLFVAHHYCMEFAVEEYDLRTGEFVGTFLPLFRDIDKMAFSPEGDLYVLRRHPQISLAIEVVKVDWRTRQQSRVVELVTDGPRGALTFGAGGELFITTKFDVYGFDTNSGSKRFIAHNEEPIWDIEAGVHDSRYIYVVTDGDKIFEIDTVNGRVTRTVVSDVEGDGPDHMTDGPLDLAIKPQPGLQNQSPIADAGPDQTVRPGGLIALSGAASSDPEGDYPLTYHWEIQQRPAGSLSSLSASDLVVTEFVPDLAGDYVVALTVTDSRGASSQDTVLVSTINVGPIADAGLDIPITEIGSIVSLDGTNSSDPDGDALTYHWEFVSRPAASFAQLSDPSSPTPQFVADVHGDYVASLIVEDAYGARSEPDTVNISFVNVAPAVVAGPDQEIIVPGTVNVSAVAMDANLDPVSYCWRMVSKPATSVATLSFTCYASTGTTSFAVDVPGYYVLEVVANDGFTDSQPASLTVTAKTLQQVLEEKLTTLSEIVLNLSATDFTPGNKQQTLLHKIDLAIAAVQAGDYPQARDHVSFVLDKANGCAKQGSVDNNDWIDNCPAQGQVYPAVREVADLLGLP